MAREKTIATSTSPLSFSLDTMKEIGSGVRWAQIGNYMVMAIDTGKSNRDRAPYSKSGKSKLLGSSGGYVAVPGTDLRANVVVGFTPDTLGPVRT